MLLEEPITAADVVSIDPDFAQHHLGTVLRGGGVAQMEALLFGELYFVAAPPDGVGADVELIKGGKKKRVTERNKKLCVPLLWASCCWPAFVCESSLTAFLVCCSLL